MGFIDKIDKKIFGEVLIIVGGFALADTLIRKFLDLSENILPWWVLPLLALLIIIGGINLKEDIKEKARNHLFLIYLIMAIVLLVLSANNLINVWWFILPGGIGGIIFFVWSIVSWSR